MTAKKLLLYLTIALTSLAILTYGAKVIYNLGGEEAKVENRDKVISDNAAYVSYVEKLLRQELETMNKKIEKQGDAIHRIELQLVAVSTKLKVKIIEEEQ